MWGLRYHKKYSPAAVITCLSFLCLAFSPIDAQEKKTLAVMDFDGFGMNKFEAQTLTERLRSNAVELRVYRIVERGAMEEVLKEQGFQQSGCISDECIVEVGKLLGVQYMLGGSIGKVGNTFTVSMRIINVETGEIIKTASYDMTGQIDQLLTGGLRDAAKVIFGVEEEAIPSPVLELASVAINSFPQGATVIIDGQELGKTPLPLSDLQPGRPYNIRLSLADYRSIESSLSLKPGRNETVRLTLKREEGFLSVAGSPSGGNIYIGKEKIGAIPLSRFSYHTGEYQLKVKKPGYFSQIEDLKLITDQETTVSIQLKRKSKGKAVLLSTFVPGTGQLYQGYSFRGLVFLAAGLAAGYLTYQGYTQFTDSQQTYETNAQLYNSEQDPQLFDNRERAALDSFDQMKDYEKNFFTMVSALGAVWTVNLIEVVF